MLDGYRRRVASRSRRSPRPFLSSDFPPPSAAASIRGLRRGLAAVVAKAD